MKTTTAARIFTVLIGFTILFELALAAGVPWGIFAWGGAFPGQLPANMRAASIGSAVLLGFFALIVLVRAGMTLPVWQALSKKLIWVVVAYSVFGIVANAISPSVWERIIWVPVTILMAVTSFMVAKARLD